MSAIGVALVYPDLLGTYGDRGNAAVLAQRLRWRGYQADVVPVALGEPVPATCELYVIGGGEDLPQGLAAAELAKGRRLHQAVAGGSVVLAVCAGLQILGERFAGPDGTPADGLGLLGCVTTATSQPRAVGEVLVEPSPHWAAQGLTDLLTGFENHGAVTELRSGTRPAGNVIAGTGNKDGTLEGATSGKVWGTYLHGPVLARNPQLADLLLTWAVGELPPLPPERDVEPRALHDERCSNGPLERRRRGQVSGARAQARYAPTA